jgi:hypothetical protein
MQAHLRLIYVCSIKHTYYVAPLRKNTSGTYDLTMHREGYVCVVDVDQWLDLVQCEMESNEVSGVCGQVERSIYQPY